MRLIDVMFCVLLLMVSGVTVLMVVAVVAGSIGSPEVEVKKMIKASEVDMVIKDFAKHIIEKHVLLSENTAIIWVNGEDVSDIIKLVFLFSEASLKEKDINFQHTLQLRFDHLSEMVQLDLSELPLEKIGVTKDELIHLLNEYDEIAHTT